VSTYSHEVNLPDHNPTKGALPAKRINFVSLKMVKESSLLYPRRKITSPQDAYELIGSLLQDADREVFITLCLDTKHQPTHINIASVGTINASLCHPREIFKVSILSNSAALICAHNHPSGDPFPSQEDIEVSGRLVSAGKLLGIELLDHLIIGGEGRFVSMREGGYLKL